MESGFTCAFRGSRRRCVIHQVASRLLLLVVIVVIVTPSTLSQTLSTTDSDDCWSSPCLNGGTCIDGVNSFSCRCATNFNGSTCQNDLRSYGCNVTNICQNNGTCRTKDTGYECVCAPGFNGVDCERDINECASNPCHTGTCIDLVNDYRCNCTTPGYTGPTCSVVQNLCLTNPCGQGTCYESPGGYSCMCPPGMTGANCSQDLDECLSSPCQQGTCHNLQNAFSCSCPPGFSGQQCQTNIDDCLPSSCPHPNTTCQDLVNNYTCVCKEGYTGVAPACTEIDECASSPCRHGGTCLDRLNNYTCVCAAGYTGRVCEIDIDECVSQPCRNNATCRQGVGLYTCSCMPGYTGRDCESDINECDSSPCKNGATCTDLINDFKCTCAPGYTNSVCGFDINECFSSPCQNNATCVDSIAAYSCNCQPGFTGVNCQTNIDECSPDPCRNGAVCRDGIQDYQCACTEGWMGKNCSQVYDACSFTPCQNGASCNTTTPRRDYTCSCLSGFTGTHCETNIDDCRNVTCQWYQRCYDGINNYTCACPVGYTGVNCSTQIDECASNPCQNGATCRDGIGNYSCECVRSHNNLTAYTYTSGYRLEFWSGWEGRDCQTDIDECSHTPAVCLNGGRCANSPGSYSCYCPGSTATGVLITGANCEVASSYCKVYGDPCKNGGTCTSLPRSYQCTCAPGFTDKNCTTNIDECASNPCQYNGTCQDGINGYTCSCIPGITGPDCQTDIDDCQARPCLHGGQCLDQINGYKCNCSDTGFTGDNCSINIDDCQSSPCVNNATCIDGIKAYNCSCYAGYAGGRCEVDVDECASSPCGQHGTCVQRSNQSLYTPPSRVPGLPPVFSFANASGFLCLCQPGFTGTQCETNIDECLSSPCQYNSTCQDGINSFTCSCTRGYEGVTCATEINECVRYTPCRNGATCQDRVGDYTCRCPDFAVGRDTYGGKNCTVLLTGCRGGSACQNGATCIPELQSELPERHSYRCACPPGFTGAFCENSTTMGFRNGSFVARRVSVPEVSLRFQTTLPSGVLLLYRPNPSTAVSVELLQARVHVAYSDATGVLNQSIPSRADINDGSWHQVRVALTQNISVTLEGQACTSVAACTLTFAYPRPLTPDAAGPLIFVGSGNGTSLSQTQSRLPFIGCMEDVAFPGEGVLVPGSSAGLQDVLPRCGRQPQCDVRTCSLHGDCRDLWYSFRCDCHRPYFGDRCEKEFIPATFYTEEPSWVLFSPTIRDSLDFSLFVITRQASSLIAHFSNNNVQGRRILKIELVNGRVGAYLNLCGATYSVGATQSQPGSGAVLDNGYRHQIRVQVTTSKLELSVNGTAMVTATNNDCRLEVDNIYLGGYNPLPNTNRRRRQTDGQYFQGVLQDVEVNGVKAQFYNDSGYSGPSMAALTSTNLTQGAVSTQPQCALGPCQNFLNCTDLFYNDYSCTCVYGYRGKNCTEPDFCVDATCPSGSTCQSLNQGYECIAVATFNGDPSTRTQFTPSFRTPRNLTSVSAQFRTRALHGVILFLSRDRHFLRLQVERGYVSLNFRLDSAFSKTLTLSSHRVDDGVWYQVTVTLQDPRITLRVDSDGMIVAEDHTDAANAEATLNDLVFGSGARAVLVGSMAESRLTGYGFLGCLQQVRVGGVLLPFFPDSSFQNNTSEEKFLLGPSTGLTLNCLNGGCQNNRCQHGATCNETWRDYQCLCAPGYTGRYCEAEVNECMSSPCSNGGLCLDQLNGFSCRCRRGFSGARCQTASTVCDVNPCQNGGNCSAVTSQLHSCSCTRDFTGWNCTTLVNTTCAASPCSNGGTCSAVNATLESGAEVESFSCRCPASHQGPQCQVAADACWDSPCLYGNCSASPSSPGYTCSCDPGYTGPNCSTAIDYCANHICHNNGECVNQRIGAYCNCSSGWEGVDCQQDVDECTTEQPCLKGVCTNLPGSFLCVCTGTGFNGTTCSDEIDECSLVPQPCQNGGVCNNTEGNYTCECQLGYTGYNCQTPFCTPDICFNSGTCQTNAVNWSCLCPLYFEGTRCEIAGPCLNQTCSPVNTERCEQDVVNDNYTCVCRQGWQGENCTEDVDECAMSPCMHGATCVNSPGNFSCTCAPGYSGWLCDFDIDECLSNPCVNGGTCQDQVNAFLCRCPDNYNGTRCQDDVDECMMGLHGCQNGATCRNTNGSYECQCKTSHLGRFCEYVNPCTQDTCQNGGTCNYTYNVNNQTYDPHCACPGGFEGSLCEKADPAIQPVEQLNIWYIIGPIIAVLVVAIIIGVVIFVRMARTKRATRGTYSPSRQETSGARVELGNVLKKPPEERLI